MSQLINLVHTIKNHRAVNNKFYDKWMSGKLSIEHIGIFARNYWELTYRFPEALAALILNVDDIIARAEYTKTLYSEMGNGCARKIHAVLFEDFCVALSERLENRDYLKIDNLKKTSVLLPETSTLINGQKLLYSKNHATAAGAQLALEWQAYTMIRQLYEGARNYMDLWEDQDSFHEVCEFFYSHIGATEKEHRLESIRATEKVIHGGASFEEVEYGFKNHLDLIGNFWESISNNIDEHNK